MSGRRPPRGGRVERASGTRRAGPERRERPAGGDRPSHVSPARLVAYDVLRDVDERDAYANLALPSRIAAAGLGPRDAALATELAAGALRWRGRYDRIIELAAGRGIDAVDRRTRNVLRLGAHQLLSMRTASHAAVNESVELQRRVGNRAAVGFVNGVLRTIGRTTNEEWDERIDEAAPNADEALAARSSHPAWVLRALRDALRAEGREDELDALLTADNHPPRVSLVRLPGGGIDLPTDDALAEAGAIAIGPSPLGFELAGGDPARAIAILDRVSGRGDDNERRDDDRHGGERHGGWVRVQDQGSQLAALALTRARPAAPGERWLDLCAGPGGKTAVLGAEALTAGATVLANELSAHRADLVHRSTVAVSAAVQIVSHDGREDTAFGGEAAHFDRILVDAPCSGLGALRRRPEARWRKQPSDLPSLTALQGELLDSAVAHLAPGGLLAYVTCSPHRAETRTVVDAALRRHPELRELDARAAVNAVVMSGGRDPVDLAGPSLSAQLWPHRHGTDAMFIALLTRD